MQLTLRWVLVLGAISLPVAEGKSQEPSSSTATKASPFGVGDLPEALNAPDDIKALQKARIAALKQAAEAAEASFASGVSSIREVVDIRRRLIDAQLEASQSKEERLAVLKEGFQVALSHWRQVNEYQKIGRSGGEQMEVNIALAEVLRFRVLWLKVKNSK